MTVGELRERLAAYPPETEVFIVTERHDLLADICMGGDPARSSVKPWLVYSSHHGRVSLYEQAALGYTNGPLQRALLERISKT